MAQNLHVARRQVGVNDVLGLHLRVADQFVRSANAFRSDIRVHCKGAMADGKSILDLLGLTAECGTTLVVEAEGCDAEDAVDALADLVSGRSHDSEDQVGEAGVLGPRVLSSKAPATAGGPPESPERSYSLSNTSSTTAGDSARTACRSPAGI
jgi:phosphocarrier protein